MSLHPYSIPPIPEETERVAKAAFPKGTLYMTIRNELGSLFEDHQFTALFAQRGQPAEAPWRLALVTILQFVENLSDRQAADAVRARLDWKYLLSLELTNPGFDASILCEFRARLLAAGAEHLLFDTLLSHLRTRGLLKAHGRQRTDSTHILAAIRTLGRLECLGETMRHGLETLATVAPTWLHGVAPAEWYDRYTRRFEDYRLPGSTAERVALGEQIGQDGAFLLEAIYAQQETEWGWLRQIPAVEILRQVWIQQFSPCDERWRWRSGDDMPPAMRLISSPYDTEARYSAKRTTTWTGYKVHLTETCDADSPHVIVDVQTTLAPVSDFVMLEPVHAAVQQRALVPNEHLVDAGYTTAEQLIASRTMYGIDLIGKVADDTSWQHKAQHGYALADFTIDWEHRQAICPQGQRSHTWVMVKDRHAHVGVHIAFAKATCQHCPVKAHCTRSPVEPRTLMLRSEEQYTALQTARSRQTTPAFQQTYAQRAGIEGTISQGVRAFALRRTRYIGLMKTHLQHVLTALALNLVRIGNWLDGETPARPRRSAFAALKSNISQPAVA